ncbi:MAG: hypothetical protein ACW964_02285 [Candidatus Hodarchaeales archaeon]|jgi:hypothetical protein
MGIQTRETVLKRIKGYLRNNPSEMKGVRGLQRNRLDGLIKRLNEFSPIETLKWNIPDRALFRDVALAAGIQFVRQYPMLYHTPNSLRACFGMPTRTDRKKGRFSSIFYRNEAVERQLRPRIEDLEKLEKIVEPVIESSYSKKATILVKYINRAKKRRYADDILDTPESDHSDMSISHLRTFLEQYNFEQLREAEELSEEELQDLDGVILAPDLVGVWRGKECWIELKEYRELKFNSKVVFQVFRYLYQNPFVLLLTTSTLPSFSQLLAQSNWDRPNLERWADEKKEELQQHIEDWNDNRSSYLTLGKSLKLNPRLETLYLSLTNEIVTREIGLAGTELKGIEKFLVLATHFSKPIKIYDFDDFYSQNLQPEDYTLLLKMNFETNSEPIQ